VCLHAALGLSACELRDAVSNTNHAARGLQGFGFAVELIPEALDVVEAICNDDIIARQNPLDGRVFLGTCVLFGLRSVVDSAGEAKGLVVDEMDFEAADARIRG